MALVDVAILFAKPEQPLHRAHVSKVGGANKLVGGQTQFIPQSPPGIRHAGHKFGFRDACVFRGALHVYAVFVGTGGHHHVVAPHLLVASHDVCHHRRIGVSDMRQAVRVIDRRG